jgi:F0F1-type ATP synthase membrane subunit a
MVAAFVVNFRLLVPLSIVCCAIIIALPLAAARSRLHIPGYVGVAFLALVLGLVSGRVSGIRGVAGTPAGLFLSLAFFLFIAVVVGSVLAIFFYRHPTQS